MPQVLKRPQAEADLDDIWWHIAQGSTDAADRLLDSIDERCATLAQFPYIGTSRDELMPDLRSVSAPRESHARPGLLPRSRRRGLRSGLCASARTLRSQLASL